jgi:hypothetical protein
MVRGEGALELSTCCEVVKDATYSLCKVSELGMFGSVSVM